ncbi:hypothetical protein LP422_23875 [Janibacter limosus]|nr:hypothetical protein LP422_23875 [Janibacter limosus]
MAGVALIRATASGTLSGSSSSRIVAIPMGTSAMPMPCRARARMRKGSEVDSPPTSAPRATIAGVTGIIRRLPYMSAMREMTGVATAPATRVAVIIHDALPAVVPMRPGRSGTRGSTIVCWSETTVPHRARTAMTTPPPPRPVGVAGAASMLEVLALISP